MSTESQEIGNPTTLKSVREVEGDRFNFNSNVFPKGRVRYTRVKDVGTRIAHAEQRNKKIIEIAKPLPEDKHLSGRAIYWFVTSEDVQVMFQDQHLFVWKERVQFTDADGTSYFLNQIDFHRNKQGIIMFCFIDGTNEIITCYSSVSKSNKRVNHSLPMPIIGNDAVNAMHIDDEIQSVQYEDNPNVNNTNQSIIETDSIPNIDTLINTPIHNGVQYQQMPRLLPNGVQVSSSEPIIINILLLVPDVTEYVELTDRALLQIGFVKEVSSEDQKRLYSEKNLINRQRHVLLFPYGKTDGYSKIQDNLPFASEVIILLENNEQGSALAAVSNVFNVKNNNTSTQYFTVKTEAIPTIELSYQDLTRSAQRLFFIDELCLPVIGGLSCKHGVDFAAIADFFLEWNLGPLSGHCAQNIFICFKYEPTKVKAFTEYAAITLKALGIESDYEALVVNGSVLVYVKCPSYMPWYILQHAYEIFCNLKEEQLTEIYECFVSDIDESINHPKNQVFIKELVYIKEQMNNGRVTSKESAKRFRITAKQNAVAALLKCTEVKCILGDYEEALKDLNRADEIEPNNILTLQHRGDAKRLLGDFEGALEDLNKADEIEPNNALTLSNRGDTKRMLGDDQGALEDLNRADEMEPNNAFTLCSRGTTKRKLGDCKGAVEDLNRADEIQPNNAYTLSNRGATKLKLGDFKGALEDLNRADEIQPNNAYTLSNRGETKLKLGDYKGALEDLNRVDGIIPNIAFILKYRGEIKQMLNDLKGALEDFNRADGIEPNDALTLHLRGVTKQKLGDYQGALEDLNRVDKIIPNTVFTLSNRGVTKLKLGDFKGALEDLNRVDEIEPNNALTLHLRGVTKLKLGDYKGALEDLNRADEILPNDAFTLQFRGVTKLALDDDQGALEDLNRADEILPNDAFTLRHRAVARYQLHFFSKALEDIMQALHMDPTNKEFLAWRSKIEEKIQHESKPSSVQENNKNSKQRCIIV